MQYTVHRQISLTFQASKPSFITTLISHTVLLKCVPLIHFLGSIVLSFFEFTGLKDYTELFVRFWWVNCEIFKIMSIRGFVIFKLFTLTLSNCHLMPIQKWMKKKQK